MENTLADEHERSVRRTKWTWRFITASIMISAVWTAVRFDRKQGRGRHA